MNELSSIFCCSKSKKLNFSSGFCVGVFFFLLQKLENRKVQVEEGIIIMGFDGMNNHKKNVVLYFSNFYCIIFLIKLVSSRSNKQEPLKCKEG